MKAKVNMRRFDTNGLGRDRAVIIVRVLNPVNCFIEMFLRAGEFIRNKEVLIVGLASPGS
jgi:hypothetical protein